MKKQTPSTFILNANDVSYFFVEGKNSSLYGPVYYVYYNSTDKPVRYNARNFIEVHGVNDKESIVNFTRKALLDLTVLQGSNTDVNGIYDTFHDVYNLVQSQDKKRPKLGKMKSSFIDAVASYNNVKEFLPGVPEISYQDNYELVMPEKVSVLKREEVASIDRKRKVVKQIVNEYDDVKGLQRKLKYD